MDGEAALDFVRRHATVDNSQVYLMGRSLGTAVAVGVAVRRPSMVAGVVVEGAFLSIDRMVDAVMPFLAPLKPLVLRMHWKTEDRVGLLQCPLLTIVGGQDEIVPSWCVLVLPRSDAPGSAPPAPLRPAPAHPPPPAPGTRNGCTSSPPRR